MMRVLFSLFFSLSVVIASAGASDIEERFFMALRTLEYKQLETEIPKIVVVGELAEKYASILSQAKKVTETREGKTYFFHPMHGGADLEFGTVVLVIVDPKTQTIRFAGPTRAIM